MELQNKIIQGDCLEVLPTLPKAKMIFADPPDSLGLKYEGFVDKWESDQSYRACFLDKAIYDVLATHSPDIFWLSLNIKHLFKVICFLNEFPNYKQRLFLWHFTFGQHNKHDCGIGYRPILRFIRNQANKWPHEEVKIYPDSIRVPSARQLKYKDKRANPAGRVPDDVWEFSRICGTFKERRKWHPNQHPEALIERIIKFSTVPGDLVIDMFAGTGTVNRVCKRLDRQCIGIEISKFYCEKIAEEAGCK